MSLNPSTFVAAVAREVKAYFAKEGGDGGELHSHIRTRLAQFWWGAESAVHYEIAAHERTLQLELGLHFEASAARNRALYGAFGRHLLEIQAQLGDSIWLEEWDRGWARLYETQSLLPMDDARVYAVAGRLCEIMECLQPVIERMRRET